MYQREINLIQKWVLTKMHKIEQIEQMTDKRKKGKNLRIAKRYSR